MRRPLALAVGLLATAGLSACNATEARGGATAPPAWVEEFNGPAGSAPDLRHWTMETGGEWGDNELQQYTARPENVALDGAGHLVITARNERYTGADGVTRNYTSARLTTHKKFTFGYGEIAARAKVPAGKGLIAGFWALGADVDQVGWPAAGEMDVFEVLGEDPSVVYGSLHGPGVGERGWALTADLRWPKPLSGTYHVYSIRWSADAIEFRIDGLLYARRTALDLPRGARWVFDHPFHLLLTLSVGGPWAGPPDSTTPWPATMLVDWIRVTPA